MKPFKYEVDLGMLPRGIDGRGLGPFCAALERVMESDGDDLVSIVPTFAAMNDRTDGQLAAFGWPTESQWARAVRETFGVEMLPSPTARRIKSRAS